MEDPNIIDIKHKYWDAIKLILKNRETRDVFVSAVPEEFFDPKAREMLQAQVNPEEWLLYHLGSQDARLSDFISWFFLANLENALMRLEVDVPLKVNKQPPCSITIQEGANLTVPCEVSSFPRPEFQWFKENIELLTQQDSQLFIPSIKLKDSGEYICRVSKKSARDNTYTWLHTNSVIVTVTTDATPKCPRPETSFPHEINSLALPLEPNPDIIEEQDLSEEKDSTPGRIIIHHQPQGYAKVPQGFSLSLGCVAVFPGPIKYQWYKNRRILEGEVSSELRLNYLYPDPQTGETKFEFFCEVFNDYDKVLTTSAIVELEEPNEFTRYLAEEKVAFLIANDSYTACETLRTPATDVSDLAKLLKLIHYKVFVFRNLTSIKMKKVLTVFFNMIKENSYAVFFFAGHGFEYRGQTYILPVDCSISCTQEECICTEYILMKMQERKPALNVLLLDACRESLPEWNEPIKIYEAPMKNNTVYGYSTSFLSSSYESEEQNSFFVKHLKEYIAQDQSIQDVLMHVQNAFERESLIKHCQNPVLKTSLSVRRKLKDSLQNPSTLLLNSFFSNSIRIEKIVCPDLKSTFIIVNKNMDTFFNGVDVGVYMVLEETANLAILNCIEINLAFNMQNIYFAPTEGVFLQDLTLKLGAKNLLFKKEVFGIQNVKNEELSGKLVMIIHPPKRIIEMCFSIDIGKAWTNFELMATENDTSEHNLHKLKS